jgi:hypothetical protein
LASFVSAGGALWRGKGRRGARGEGARKNEAAMGRRRRSGRRNLMVQWGGLVVLWHGRVRGCSPAWWVGSGCERSTRILMPS